MEFFEDLVDLIGQLIIFIGILPLFLVYFMSILSGFRLNFTWGISMAFFPPIAQIIFVIKHSWRARKWSKPFLYGSVAIFIGAVIVDNTVIGVLLILMAVGAIFYKVLSNSKQIPGLGWLSKTGVKSIKANGIQFDPDRYFEFVNHREEFLTKWSGVARVRVAYKAFSKPGMIQDLKKFIQKHFFEMIRSYSGKVNWKDERIQLFLEVMRKKYNLRDRTIIALLLYVFDEMNFKNYASNFQGISSADFSVIMKEIVLHDIYSESEPNFYYIQRVLGDLMGSQVSMGRVKSSYKRERKELKVSHFEKSLEKDDDAPYIGVEKQIKSEIQLAAINSKIQSLLDISPENYHIVGRDYSRDSRIDNYYRKNFSYTLSRAFDGHCCKCGEGMGQLEFDHFWLPKSSGGNFLMRSKSGLYVNNCIPLCRSCNSSKGYKDFREFFTEEEIEDVIRRSKSIEKQINQQMVDFDDPDFPNRAF